MRPSLTKGEAEMTRRRNSLFVLAISGMILSMAFTSSHLRSDGTGAGSARRRFVGQTADAREGASRP